MSSKQVEFIVKLRDSALMLAEAADEFLKAMAPPELGLETQPTAVIETTFVILKWEAQKGSQLGDFDTAFKTNNIPDKWQPAYNILRASNATIKDRYHGKDYAYSYWIYGQDKNLPPKTQTKNFKLRTLFHGRTRQNMRRLRKLESQRKSLYLL